PSLEPEHAESAAINAIRKDFDDKQLALLKSGKRQPVSLSSRHYDFKNKKLVFLRAGEDDIYRFLRLKVFWTATRVSAAARIADPMDLDYLNASKEQLIAAARRLEAESLATLEKGFAAATEKLRGLAQEFEYQKHDALSALVAKHAYERG